MVSKILIISLVVCTANAAVWMGLLPEKPKEFGEFDYFISFAIVKIRYELIYEILIN